MNSYEAARRWATPSLHPPRFAHADELRVIYNHHTGLFRLPPQVRLEPGESALCALVGLPGFNDFTGFNVPRPIPETANHAAADKFRRRSPTPRAFPFP